MNLQWVLADYVPRHELRGPGGIVAVIRLNDDGVTIKHAKRRGFIHEADGVVYVPIAGKTVDELKDELLLLFALES